MASKVCGRKSGVAKQSIVIPVVIGSNIQSIIAGLEALLNDIPIRRKRGQALPGKTVVSMSLGVNSDNQGYITQLQNTVKAIMDLGVIVVVAAMNERLKSGFANTLYPAKLAPNFPSLIRIGAVDKTGQLADFSQQGDLYTCGVEALCADKDSSFFEVDSDGSSGGEPARPILPAPLRSSSFS